MDEVNTILLTESAGDTLCVTLNRPTVRNAFNAELITRLHDVFTDEALCGSARAIVLQGSGSVFCAGADLTWMRASAGLSPQENRQDAIRMSEMFQSIRNHPLPVIAKVQGAALGGGAGLMAAADVAIISDDAKVGFTEVRLGIIPAVISPFALEKIGVTHARRYFLTGEVFDGVEATRIGLAQASCPSSELDAEVQRVVDALHRAGPAAVREAKALALALGAGEISSVHEETAKRISAIRTTPEAQNGMASFLSGEKPPWVTKRGDDS